MVDEVALFCLPIDDLVTIWAKGKRIFLSTGEGSQYTTTLNPERAAKIGRALLRAAEHVAPQQAM